MAISGLTWSSGCFHASQTSSPSTKLQKVVFSTITVRFATSNMLNMEHIDVLSWNIEENIQKLLWLSLSLLSLSVTVFTNLIKGEHVSTLRLSTHTGNKKTDTGMNYTSGSVVFKLQVLWLHYLMLNECLCCAPGRHFRV